MTLPNNARSRAVIERCGLTYRGTLEFHGYVQVHYAIDRGDLRHGVELAPMTIREVSA
jgi:RimJ/RimL family protein N-acetyltransferase